MDGVNHQGKVASEGGQLCISSSQNVGFFDHQFFWKKSNHSAELAIKGR